MEFPLRVCIVDPQSVFRLGLKSFLEEEPDIRVVAEASSASEAFRLVEQTRPDVVTLDSRLCDMSGIELAQLLRQKWPELKILMLSSYNFGQHLRDAARVGIDGYLLKDAYQEELVQMLRLVTAGGQLLWLG